MGDKPLNNTLSRSSHLAIGGFEHWLINKAGYTATSVACGWAGAVIELLEHLGKSDEAKERKNIKKVKWGPTDGPTDRPTDGQSGV